MTQQKNIVRYVLRDGQIVIAKQLETLPLKTLSELTSSQFDIEPRPSEIETHYDVDGDGIADRLTASYWGRWNLIM